MGSQHKYPFHEPKDAANRSIKAIVQYLEDLKEFQVINILKSAAFLFQTSENNLKPP